MKTKLVLGAIAAAVAVFSQGAFAQASSPSRAEVKAEAKKGAIAPAGEGPQQKVTKSSETTKEARKAQAKADQKAGNIERTGEAAGMKEEKPMKGSDTTKEARKAQTKADAKAGKLTPAGEGEVKK